MHRAASSFRAAALAALLTSLPLCALPLAGCGGTGRVEDNPYRGVYAGTVVTLPSGVASRQDAGLSLTVSGDGGIQGTAQEAVTGSDGVAVTLLGTAGGRISKQGDMDMTVSFPATRSTPALSTEFTGPVNLITEGDAVHMISDLKQPSGTGTLDLTKG